MLRLPSTPLLRGARLRRRLVVLAVMAAAGLLGRGPVERHLRSAGLLLRVADPQGASVLAAFGTYALDEEEALLATPGGEVRARYYLPRGLVGAPGVVLAHGVHRLGIDEPRLVRFARALAGSGVVVLTPELRGIADYRIDASSIPPIGDAALALAGRLHATRVGVMGMSFAGGLSLLAAADPRYRATVGFVLAVGAQDDTSRVLRFFATDRIERPDGTVAALHAHDYGAMVLVHAHPEAFFSGGDVPAAREAVRLWLWERPEEARALAASLSEPGRARLALLFDHRLAPIAPELLAEIERDAAASSSVSPHGHLEGLTAHVFLLHGAGDTVIPPTETLWLARDVPGGLVRATLVSDALVHVELEGEPPLRDRWALVHFMAGVLEEADATR